MTTKLDLTVNIADVVDLIRTAGKAKLGFDIGNITVTSWNAVVLQVIDETLEVPVRHHLREEHADGIFKKD
jgi:hypothetical protein